jgi:hypothetical protein
MCTVRAIPAHYEAVRCSWVPGCSQVTLVADEQAVHDRARPTTTPLTCLRLGSLSLPI